MSWINDHYLIDDDGNFENDEEIQEAVDNGDLKELSDGSYWDPETDTEYWWDGEKK